MTHLVRTLRFEDWRWTQNDGFSRVSLREALVGTGNVTPFAIQVDSFSPVNADSRVQVLRFAPLCYRIVVGQYVYTSRNPTCLLPEILLIPLPGRDSEWFVGEEWTVHAQAAGGGRPVWMKA